MQLLYLFNECSRQGVDVLINEWLDNLNGVSDAKKCQLGTRQDRDRKCHREMRESTQELEKVQKGSSCVGKVRARTGMRLHKGKN